MVTTSATGWWSRCHHQKRGQQRVGPCTLAAHVAKVWPRYPGQPGHSHLLAKETWATWRFGPGQPGRGHIHRLALANPRQPERGHVLAEGSPGPSRGERVRWWAHDAVHGEHEMIQSGCNETSSPPSPPMYSAIATRPLHYLAQLCTVWLQPDLSCPLPWKLLELSPRPGSVETWNVPKSSPGPPPNVRHDHSVWLRMLTSVVEAPAHSSSNGHSVWLQ